MEKLDMFSGYEKLVKAEMPQPTQQDDYELFAGSDEDGQENQTPQPQPQAQAGMSEDDMTKIALKVAELLKAGKEE